MSNAGKPQDTRITGKPQDTRIKGSNADAEAWVNASTINAADKAVLLRFIRRFPNMMFYKQIDSALDEAERRHNVKLPAWFREFRTTLAHALAGDRPKVQFDAFDDWSPRADRLDQLWYGLALYGYPDDEVRELLERDQTLFPIGDLVGTNQSSLAINLADAHDHAIYEYARADLYDADAEGNSPSVSVRRVFKTYGSLYDHIIAIREENGNTLHAQ